MFIALSSHHCLAAKVLGKEEIIHLQKSFKSKSEISVDFTQTQTKKLRGKTRTSLGRAYFKAPDLFRWQLLSPQKDEWIFDGSHLYNFAPDQLLAYKYEAKGSKGRELRQIIELVSNYSTLEDSYNFLSVTEESNQVEIELQPKQKGDLTGVTLKLNKATSEPKYLILKFANGNETRLDFANASSSTLSESTFSVPKDVKIETVK